MLKFDIAGHRKIWFLISALIIIPGLICMAVRGFNFGIDFTGGTIIDLKFNQPVSIAEVRTSLAKYDLDDATIQLSGAQSDVKESEDVMIRTRDLEEDQRKEVMATLKSDVGDYKVLREEKVGATIGGELITNAILALVVSWALIILYVAYRFELRFGIAAVLALIHPSNRRCICACGEDVAFKAGEGLGHLIAIVLAVQQGLQPGLERLGRQTQVAVAIGPGQIHIQRQFGMGHGGRLVGIRTELLDQRRQPGQDVVALAAHLNAQ